MDTHPRLASNACLALLLCLLASFAGAQAQTANPLENRYEVLSPPQPTSDPDRVEVLEVFWYGCPHCNAFQPYIDPWQANKPDYVDFVRMPAIFRKNWEIHARAFYTSKLMDALEKTHKQMFTAIHQKQQQFTDKASLRTFFVEQGIAAEAFDKHYDSFGVNSGIRRSVVMQQRYGIRGVPAVIVNGKYRVSGSVAGSYANMIKVIDALVDKERKEMMAGN